MAYIFLVTHRESGKRYVGCSIKSPEKRWKTLLWGNYKRAITQDVKAYGFEAFDTSVIEECPDEIRFDRAAHWVEELNTLAPSGYNQRKDDKYNRAKAQKRGVK